MERSILSLYLRRQKLITLVMASLGGATIGAAQTEVAVGTTVPPAVSHATLLGHLDSSTVLHVNVTLSLPDPKAVEAFVSQVNDPKNHNFRNFVTPKQFGLMFGQPLGNFQKVEKFLTSNGFKITLAGDNHLSINADCAAGDAEQAFHTAINRYKAASGSDSRPEFFSFSTPLHVPKELGSLVLNVGGLENSRIPRPKFSRKLQGNPSALDPNQTHVLYDLQPLYSSSLQGQGRTIGISSFGGFQLSNLPLWYNQYNLPTPATGVGSNVTVTTINGGLGTTPPNFEADLDIQMVLGQAPLCKLIIYDCAGDDIACLTKEVQDNLADMLTESYGFPYDSSQADAGHALHLQMSAQGQTFMNASGDTGTNLAPAPYSWPDYDPEIVNVGGTVATFTSSGTRQSEVGWFGSGGGWVLSPSVSFNVLPTWQKGNGVPSGINFRLVPDLALVAAGSNGTNDPGAYYVYYQQNLITGDGTSFASPVFTGGMAVVEQRLIARGLKPTSAGLYRLGNINPFVYSQNGRADVWFDVVSGTNGTLPDGVTSSAGIGWDFVTGWGAPDFAGLAKSYPIATPKTLLPKASIFASQGSGSQGTGLNLGAVDGSYYSVNSVNSGLGPIAAAELTFTVSVSGSSLSSASLNLASIAPKGVTEFVYLYNWQTKAYDLIASNLSSGQMLNFPVNLNVAKYVGSNKQVIAVERGVYPARLGSTPFSLKIDQATLLESY